MTTLGVQSFPHERRMMDANADQLVDIGRLADPLRGEKVLSFFSGDESFK